jgi:hypothetical protein
MSVCPPRNGDRQGPEEHHDLDRISLSLAEPKPGGHVDILALKGFRDLFDSWQSPSQLLDKDALQTAQLIRRHGVE